MITYKDQLWQPLLASTLIVDSSKNTTSNSQFPMITTTSNQFQRLPQLTAYMTNFDYHSNDQFIVFNSLLL